MPPSCPPALLALANGAVFYGDSVGASGSTVGEVAFNTALTGYQEILTDPRYARQIVTLTAPHIGNTGVNEEDIESSHIQAAGLVVRDMPAVPSNFRMRQTRAEGSGNAGQRINPYGFNRCALSVDANGMAGGQGLWGL